VRSPALHDRLGQNRLVSRLNADLKTEGSLEVGEIARRLSVWCPYVTATTQTWQTYAHLLAAWLDFADLATYKSGTLSYYEPATELRQRDLNFRRVRRKEISIPGIQFSPVENVALEIGKLMESGEADWERFSKSTRLKAFAILEDLGFLSRRPQGYRLNQEFLVLINADREARRAHFAAAVLRLPAFAQFLNLLAEYGQTGCTHLELGRRLTSALGVQWKDGTGHTNVKIMLDWARHLGLAPGVFVQDLRKRKSSTVGEGASSS
jgi:hypothetical protein